MNDERRAVRLFFEKSGRAVYISHLDLLRTMQRAIKRSGLPVWYSEGYNPRIYLNFPLALPVGCEGMNEAMDLYTIGEVPADEFVRRLGAVLPEGIYAKSAAAPVHTNKEIGSAEYEVCFEGTDEDSVRRFLDSDRIEVEKRSKKKGMILMDIKPHITVNGISSRDGRTIVDMRLPAGNELNINAALFTDAFIGNSGGSLLYTKRTKILCADGGEFK